MEVFGFELRIISVGYLPSSRQLNFGAFYFGVLNCCERKLFEMSGLSFLVVTTLKTKDFHLSSASIFVSSMSKNLNFKFIKMARVHILETNP